MISFGVDPGSQKTGWGAVRAEGSRLIHLGSGVIRAGRGALPARLQKIFDGLNEALEKHQPERVFLESIFHSKNARSALVLGHARGVALLAASISKRPVGEIAPTEVKKAVTGRGRAEKAQVQEMVKILLGLREKAQEDQSDALAVAIAGATRAQWAELKGGAYDQQTSR